MKDQHPAASGVSRPHEGDIRIVPVTTGQQIDQVRALFREYGSSLGFDLCFQGFEEELAGLPGAYAPPPGALLLATVGEEPAGCVGLRPLSVSGDHQDEEEHTYCEMKRLYVRPQFRGYALGRRLAEQIVVEAESPARDYRWMRLDTIGAQMVAAVSLYRSLGFYEIAPYRHNPIPGALYMELKLRSNR